MAIESLNACYRRSRSPTAGLQQNLPMKPRNDVRETAPGQDAVGGKKVVNCRLAARIAAS